MAQIGSFIRTRNGFSGRLRTLSLDIELTIVPADHSDAENAPNYRVHARDEDGPEVGAGWTRTGEKAGEYVALPSRVPAADPRQPVPVRQRSLRIPSALDASPKTPSTELIHVVAAPTE
jgi:uncharacterized protein (DUF736 family)